ncbi:unnamed protein product [Brassicogethes aeneus]|uniref:Rho-GAP domain-containing protein n=1 Tax=Brassicogethes aeneus TaxID=1431903 RepID=A0A9P0FLF1_BRAAE|nr:unnamed protein product [Brassicogethes aeneus]
MSNYEDNYSNIYCLRFEFGIPLEDLFPCDDVHFKLKTLLSECVEAKEKSELKVESILRDSPVILKECFKLKFLLENELHIQRRFQPITYFWIIRHFLGILPLPIFVNYEKWKSIASNCHQILSSLKPYDLKKLDGNIAESLNLLSDANIMFLDLFREVFAKLCENRYRISRRSAYSVAKYFGPCMFVRPFRPGYVTKETKEFSSLLFYMLIRWKFIKRCCRNLDLLSFRREKYDVKYKIIPFNVNNNYIKDGESQTIANQENNEYLKDIGCQTIESLSLNDEEKVNTLKQKCSLASLKSITKRIKSTFLSNHDDIDQDKSEDEDVLDFQDKSYVNLDILKDDMDNIKAVDVILPPQKNCCCSYGSHYEKNKEPKVTIKKDIDDVSIKSVCETIYEDEVSCFTTVTIPDISGNINSLEVEDFGDKPPSIGWIKQSPAPTTDGFMYDDYDTFKCEEYNQVDLYEDVKFLDPLFSSEIAPSPKLSETLSKISKIGWTYTPPNKSEIKAKYQTCFEESDKEVTQNIIDYPSECNSVKSRSSYLSLKKIKVGVDFVKKITRGSPSHVDNTPCTVKYKKLPKFKSSTF